MSESGKPRTIHDIKSLGHSDRRLAERQAKALAAKVAEARLTGVTPDSITLGQVFDRYRRERLPALREKYRRHAVTRMSLFEQAWGRGARVSDIRNSARARSIDTALYAAPASFRHSIPKAPRTGKARSHARSATVRSPVTSGGCRRSSTSPDDSMSMDAGFSVRTHSTTLGGRRRRTLASPSRRTNGARRPWSTPTKSTHAAVFGAY